MKRHLPLSTSTSPERKRAKPNEQLPTYDEQLPTYDEQLPTYFDILEPLYISNKLQGDGNGSGSESESESESEDFFSKTNAHASFSQAGLEEGSGSVVQRQLGQFITNQLANSPYSQFYQPFAKLNVRTHPTQEAMKQPWENIDQLAYNPNNRTIDINTYNDQRDMVDPLSILIHEGTHALDDLSTRNSYTSAIPTLAKTEFSAHAIENLHKPWNIDKYSQKEDGRRFLKGLTKGTYKGFQKLDPQFAEKYPDANQAFKDRITQMRNYDKYPTTDEYIKKKGYTMIPDSKSSQEN